MLPVILRKIVVGLQQADEKGEKQIRGLPRAKVLREVALDTILLLPPKGGLVSTISTRSLCSHLK